MESPGTQPEADELAPEIDGIEIHEALGAGGMGLVFRGIREAGGEPLAVKVLPRSLSGDPEWRERFQREAAALSVLDHPGIVKILGTGETLDGRLYLAMELVEGCDLRRLLRTGRLEPARALDIAEKVTAALAHAHSRGIVHRDIKPGNILIGDGGMVKVADFGIARAISGEASSFTLTQTCEAFGTPYYIAPEIAGNAAAATPASDIYAVGVMLYEMLTGRVPMGNFTPASQEAGVDHRVDALIASALSDNAAARTGTMETLQHALQEVRRRLERKAATGRGRRAAALVGALALAAGSSVWITHHILSGQSGPQFIPASAASRAQPWENSLGMPFVPAAGTGLLFSVYETRRQDYQPYAEEMGMMDSLDGLSNAPLKLYTIRDGQEVFDDSTWQDPGFGQSGEHPVVGITVLNAIHFCRWLTTRERTEGRLLRGQRYRLPSSGEWDAAFSTGAPVPGNLAGREVTASGWPAALPHAGTTDLFPRTAPAGSFPANASGLFDMEGNVMEACMDFTLPASPEAKRNFRTSITVRGGSWRTAEPRVPEMPEKRAQMKPFIRRADAGFRVVLELAQDEPAPAGQE